MRKNPLSNMSAHGGIITSEFLETIRGEKVANPRVQPESFATFNAAAPKDKRELDQQIVDSWDRLRERWDALSSRYLKMNVSDARSKWMIPLFKELGFDPAFIKEDIVVDGDDKLRFRLSHRGGVSSSAPIVHMVAPAQDLEEAADGSEGETSRRGRNRSPHDEMQAFLNVSKRCEWGIVTNGILLRVLREYYHTTTKGYVEFDIENIFRERSFTDFRALYRMVQASRFLPDKEGLCHLEQFYKESVAAGVSVGENLRRNVKKAIEALGNGFLTPDSAKKMISDEELCKAYYSELLRVVYRLLFLLFAEQRAMLPTRDSLYVEEYSITRLREMAETRRGKDEHHDLWEGLKVTFQMLKNGCPPLKVFGYNGSLFDDSEIRILSELTCKNEDILAAIHHLTLVEEEKVLKRINYLDLGVEEIGSIYESLLDFSPIIFASEQEVEGEKVPSNAFFLDPRGAGRKTTGSYYTHPRLIDELIKSALRPVVEKKLANALDKEKALLSTRVCDPACGSGAFLIAANNYLARELARLRTDQSEPPDSEVKKARRDVLQHCIYGVDLNPMAVELAKVSLWINSCVEDMPLSFLDHHLKCGNSLIGATPELLIQGVPDKAFIPVVGDDKEFATSVKKKNSLEKKQKLIEEFVVSDQFKLAKEYSELNNFSEESVNAVEEKKRKFDALRRSPDWRSQKLLSNAWTGTYFWLLKKGSTPPPTQASLRMIQNREGHGIDVTVISMVEELAQQYRFFHWYLEFPDVFGMQGGGFDCVLANPPWERWRPEEKQFFSGNTPEIAELEGDTRKRAIEQLEATCPDLIEAWTRYKRNFKLAARYWKSSGRFGSTGGGEINTFALFSELAKQVLGPKGRAGIIVPSAIATDDSHKEFFSDLICNNLIESLFDFENREGLFHGVDSRYRFSLFTVRGSSEDKPSQYAFFLRNTNQLRDERRRFALSHYDFELLNPNTHTCPIFRTRHDADLTKKIYNKLSVLVNHKTRENPWKLTIRRLYDMSIREIHAATVSPRQVESDMPIWESKLIWQYDHRFATYEGCDKNMMVQGNPIHIEPNKKKNPELTSKPRRWMPAKHCQKILKNWAKKHTWLLALRDVTNATNERTVIASIIPLGAPDFTLRILFLEDAGLAPLLLANLNSLVLDYVARQKIGGMHMSDYITEQLPIISPSAYSQEDVEFILPRTLELVYTASDLKPFAEEMGSEDKPSVWDEERRSTIRAELDAYFAFLYGLNRDELRYILDPQDPMGDSFPSETFRVLKKNEMSKFGEYRTKRQVLDAWDRLLPNGTQKA